MNARTRSRLEMARRALEFAQTHPDSSDGYTAAVGELAELLARSKQLADLHRQGIAEVRAATQRKTNLRRSICQGQMLHVATAAQRAAKEEPELAQKFVLARQPVPCLTRKELLVRHGLVDSVLVSLAESLADFDQAVGQGAEGRRIHVAAAVELDVVADDAVQIVRVMDGHNRVRFAGDPDQLAAWRSAANVIGPARTGGKADRRTENPPGMPTSGGEIKPAA